MNRILFFLGFSFLLFSLPLSSQKRVLGYPEAYKLPQNPYESGKVDEFISQRTWSDVDRKKAWRVVPDRLGVTGHKDPSVSSGKISELEWGRSYYVTDTKGEWLELIDANVNGIEIRTMKKKFGWVKAADLLLWNEALINPRTKIHLKSLLLNRYDNINNISCDDKEMVQVFLNPSGTASKDSSRIYSFYFVYKMEGSRYLLGETPQLQRDASANLLGWVDKERLAEWNTRIALEPNFSEQAFSERKSNPRLRTVGFDDRFTAEDYSSTGKVAPKDIVWSRDPVTAKKQELSKSDSKRFRSEYMRFPLLSVGAGKGTLPYFKSAVCDSVIVKKGCDPETGKVIVSQIPTSEAIDAEKFLQKYQNAANNFDIFFVIESSSEMAAYQSAIASLSSSLKKLISEERENAVVRFGALAYGDVASGKKPDELVSFSGLASNVSTFSKFVDNIDFSNGETNGDLPVQNFAISKAIEVANFSPYNTNVMIILGARGDFSQNRLRKRAFSGSELIPDPTEISTSINKNNLNIFALQCVGGDSEPYNSFSRNLRGILLESARKNYNANLAPGKIDDRVKKVMEKNNMTLSPPSMEDPDAVSSEELVLKNGTLQGGIYRIRTSGRAISNEAFSESIREDVAFVAKENIDLAAKLENYKNGTVPKDGFTPRGLDIIGQLYKQQDIGDDWAYEKFELYKPVFFARQPKDAVNPTFSYVLFWPVHDLINYNQILQKTLVGVADASYADRRELLKDSYCELLDQFTGGKSKTKECGDYTIDEIEQIIQGVENEGISFSSRSISIGDLLDRRKVSDEEIEQIIQDQIKVKSRLKEILSGAKQDFSFERGNSEFFWIKVEDIY